MKTSRLTSASMVGLFVLVCVALRAEAGVVNYHDSLVLRFTDTGGIQYACAYKVVNYNEGLSEVRTWWRQHGQTNWTSTGKVRIGCYGVSKARFVVLANENRASIVAVCLETGGFTTNVLHVVAVRFPPTQRASLLFSEAYESSLRYHCDKDSVLRGLTLGKLLWHADVDKTRFPGHLLVCRRYGWNRHSRRFLGGPVKPDVIAEGKLSLAAALTTIASDLIGVKREGSEGGDLVCTYAPVGILKAKTAKEYRSAKRLRVRLERVGGADSGKFRVVSYELIL